MPSLHNHPAFAGASSGASHGHRRTNTDDSASSHAPSINAPSTHPSEEHPAFQQHELQQAILQSDAAENTAEKAVYRIVEMGFPAERARYALRVTDMGDGLRVDRAVELLLREG